MNFFSTVLTFCKADPGSPVWQLSKEATRNPSRVCVWRMWPQEPCKIQEPPSSQASIDPWPLLPLYTVTFTADKQMVVQCRQWHEAVVRDVDVDPDFQRQLNPCSKLWLCVNHRRKYRNKTETWSWEWTGETRALNLFCFLCLCVSQFLDVWMCVCMCTCVCAPGPPSVFTVVSKNQRPWSSNQTLLLPSYPLLCKDRSARTLWNQN